MEAKQSGKRIKAGGSVRQKSNIPATQTLSDIGATSDVEQLVEVVSPNIELIAAQLKELISQIKKYDPNATADIER